MSKFHQPKPGDSYAEKLGPLGGDEKVHQPPCGVGQLGGMIFTLAPRVSLEESNFSDPQW